MTTETGSRTALSQQLQLVRDFVNTNDLGASRDEIADIAGLRSWLERNQLLTHVHKITPGDLQSVVKFREGVRELFMAKGGGPSLTSVTKMLDQIAAEVPVVVRIGADGETQLEPGGVGASYLLARLVMAIHDAQTDGSWERLKACASDSCRWAFYDRSKNRSRIWCSLCGDKERARRYRRRRRGGVA